MLQQVQQHPVLLLLAAVLCLPMLGPLIRFFFPFKTSTARDDEEFGFYWGPNDGWWISPSLLFPLLRFVLLIAIYAVLTLGICCGLMTLFARGS